MNPNEIIRDLNALDDKMGALISELGDLDDCFQELKKIVRQVIVDDRFVKLDKAGILLDGSSDCLSKTIDSLAHVLGNDYIESAQKTYLYMCGLMCALTEYKKYK